MERRDGHDAGQGAVKDKHSEIRESQTVTEKLRQKGVERQMTLTIQVECQKEMKKSRRRTRSSQSRTPPPRQSLTKQEQFGEVWKERESTRLAEKFGQRRRRDAERRDSWREDSRDSLYLPTYL